MNTLPPPLQQIDRTCVRYRNRKLSYFGGCDYFRLASHPAVLDALQDGARKYGLNVAASRTTTGNHLLYEKLEKQLTKFFGVESAVLVSSGYVTGLVVAQALAGSFSHVLLDERAHVSLIDAAGLFGCPMLTFKHRSVTDCRRALQRCGKGAKPILLTDGLFAHDGAVAPIREYLELLRPDGWLLIDDAHGAGVLGANGRGTPEHFVVGRKRIIQTVTLSKAFGVYGGAVLGSHSLIRKIQTMSRLFVGNTPLPLPLIQAALKSLELFQKDASLRQRLHRNTDHVKNILRAAGWSLPETPGPIVSLTLRKPDEVAQLKKKLLAQRIFPPFICYPGGSTSGYFRFVISSEHSPSQLDRLISVLLPYAKSATVS